MNYIEELELQMLKAVENLEERLITIRAGRANGSMLNGIMVEYYGTPTPINQIANITVPEARQLFIKPFAFNIFFVCVLFNIISIVLYLLISIHNNIFHILKYNLPFSQ